MLEFNNRWASKTFANLGGTIWKKANKKNYSMPFSGLNQDVVVDVAIKKNKKNEVKGCIGSCLGGCKCGGNKR